MDSCDGCGILGALLLVAHDDGDLDDDDLLVLAAMLVEFASARGLLRIDFSLHLGNRLHLSSLDVEICLSRFRFTRKQIEDKRTHTLKLQIVTTPDGLIAHAFGPVEGCRYDAGVLGESGLLPLLQQNMNGPGVCLMPCMETPPTLSAVILKTDFRVISGTTQTDVQQ